MTMRSFFLSMDTKLLETFAEIAYKHITHTIYHIFKSMLVCYSKFSPGVLCLVRTRY